MNKYNQTYIDTCVVCGEPIAEEDTRYRFGEDVVCEECVRDYVDDNFKEGGSIWIG